MPRRTWLIRWIALPLLLGATTTVGVTWGLAAWLPQRNWPETLIRCHEHPGFSLFFSEYRTTGAMRRDWSLDLSLISRMHPFLEVIEDPSATAVIDVPLKEFKSCDPGTPRSIQSWGRGSEWRANPLGFPQDGLEHATGWPLLAGWYAVNDTWTSEMPTGEDSYEVEGGIHLERTPGGWPSGFHTFRALPLRPIWPGLIVNTIFYAALWLIPFRGIRAAKRSRRRRRGRCAACGYSLIGLVGQSRTCPECGAHAK